MILILYFNSHTISSRSYLCMICRCANCRYSPTNTIYLLNSINIIFSSLIIYSRHYLSLSILGINHSRIIWANSLTI
nr:MAG TPA: hypothetical protein [Caudoviricetes sp.]